MTKTKSVQFKTARGLALYPHLDRLYAWNDAANKSMPHPDGDYDTKLIVSAKEAAPMIELIKQTIKDAGIKPKFLPFSDEIDKETGEKTGNVIFTLKRYGKSQDGKLNKIGFFDAKGRMIQRTIEITTGSTIICSGWISVSAKSARLNLKNVQIIKLIERQLDGFDPVEDDDAFVADDDATDNEFVNEEEPDSGRPNF